VTRRTLNGPLPPGSTIGILGGGQLGRMLAMAAARLGFRTHVYCPDAERPAADVAAAATVADYDDEAALAAFAAAVDVVTYEFENIPEPTVAFLEPLVPVRPSAAALAVAQDRLSEKAFLRDIGIGTAPFHSVDDVAGLDEAVAAIGLPAVLKTRRLGYDGKGQAFLGDRSDTANAWAAVGRRPAILEGFVHFACEVSVIVARSVDGDVACYDPVHNVHRNHVLARSIVPAGIPDAAAAAAQQIAQRIVEKLDYVGVMAVEMFFDDADGGRLSVNELAPRVHNSGHWTLEACLVSQFEQHVRAVCGWPLGEPRRHADAVMENLLGDAAADWPALSREDGAAIHLYGKTQVAPGRKMGHVTRLYPLGTCPDS